MLEITTDAAQAIRGILASDSVPDGAVVRISSQQGTEDAESGLAVSVTESPPPEDQVIEEEDVKVCVEPAAAELLDDKQLDASVADGRVQFSLSAQAA